MNPAIRFLLILTHFGDFVKTGIGLEMMIFRDCFQVAGQ